MTMRQRVQTWQSAAFHHALSYYGLAHKLTPFLLNKGYRIVKARAVQTVLETNGGNHIRVTYKRQSNFAGRRICLTVNGSNHYFGPRDLGAIKSLLNTVS